MSEKGEKMLKSWLNVEDIKKLVPDISKKAARKLIKDIHQDMRREGAYIFSCKKLLAPANRVYEKLEIKEL